MIRALDRTSSGRRDRFGRWTLLLSFACCLAAVPDGRGVAAFSQQQGIIEGGDRTALQDHYKESVSPEGAVSWQVLTELETTVKVTGPLQTEMDSKPSAAVRALDGTDVKIMGFIYPLEGGETHARFLLSAYPPSCPFCLPGGPTELVEVQCDEPVDFTYDPVLLAGRFELLEDDPYGMMYRLTGARAVAR